MDSETQGYFESMAGSLKKMANPLIVNEDIAIRREALRAASRIVGPLELPVWEPGRVYEGRPLFTTNEATLIVAEQFAKWLETGEK